MSRTRTLILLTCLAVMSSAWATSVNENQARRIAANFMASHAMPATSLKIAHKATLTGSEKAAYYVFNANRGGFIIITGDDLTPAVLGYSDKGTFDPQEIPEAMQDLLEGYAAQIEAISMGANPAPMTRSGAAIRPMLDCAWSQNNPYNILLPFLSTGKHAVVGCVATAMAQVMYFWRWPACSTMPIPAYTSSSLGIDMPELPVVDFNWDLMQSTYLTTDTTSAEALEAAKLSLYCAQSVEMDFKTSSSGAVTPAVALALSTYFGYSAAAHTLSRGNYTTQEWNDALYNELAAGRPVIYSGSKASGAHAFVCDGYDGNGMFHINWGWNGNSNGYFLLNVLNPELQGTGSASGAYGYIYRQSALVGIQPDDGGFNEFMITATNMVLNSYNGTRSYSSDNFTATLSVHFYNYTSEVLAARFGWGLFKDNTMLSRLYSAYNTSLRPGRYINSQEKEVSFGTGLDNGTYRILPICSEYGQDNWRPCAGADKNYIEVVINGNNCTFTGIGNAGERDYTVNSITTRGTMHVNRPIDINVNLTNNGMSSNELLHMFVNGEFQASAYVSLEKDETGDIPFSFMTDAAGTYTLTFSWDDDGSNPIATRTLNISEMPVANLSASVEVLNVTDVTNKIITDNKFSAKVTITNNGTTTYNEDILVKLFKRTTGSSGSSVQGKSQTIVLAPGETTTLQFDMDNVIDGWQYFIWSYCYSGGIETKLKGSTSYTVVFPEVPEIVTGDVNDDGNVDINDVTDLIDYLLGTGTINMQAADLDGDEIISIHDVTTLIDILLGLGCRCSNA